MIPTQENLDSIRKYGSNRLVHQHLLVRGDDTVEQRFDPDVTKELLSLDY